MKTLTFIRAGFDNRVSLPHFSMVATVNRNFHCISSGAGMRGLADARIGASTGINLSFLEQHGFDQAVCPGKTSSGCPPFGLDWFRWIGRDFRGHALLIQYGIDGPRRR